MKKFFSSVCRTDGFSLVEMILVASIIGLFSVLMLVKFRTIESNEVILTREAHSIISNLRRAQELTLAGAQAFDTGGAANDVCGYGITQPQQNPKNTHYLLYAGSTGGAAGCKLAQQSFQGGATAPDILAEDIYIKNVKVEIKNSGSSGYKDIFFESPGAKVYFRNSAASGGGCEHIIIGIVGLSCGTLPNNCPGVVNSANCKTIRVWGSGKIELL